MSKKLGEGFQVSKPTLTANVERVLDRMYTSSWYFLHKLAAKIYFNHGSRLLRKQTGLEITSGDSYQIKQLTELPPLAWVGIQSESGWSFTTGMGVEIRERGFYEGIWDGDFSESEPHDSDSAFGSGVNMSNGILTVLTPRHPYESTWVIQSPKKTYVSNSLAFALEVANISEDSPFFLAITSAIASETFKESQKGVDRSGSLIAAVGHVQLLRMNFFDFSIDSLGRINRLWRKPVKITPTFEAYSEMVSRTLKSLGANGRSKSRKGQFQPLVALSRGYDSAAVASWVSSEPNVTYVTLNVNVLGLNDGGKSVAEALGHNALEFHHFISDNIENLRFDFSGPLIGITEEFIATEGVGDDSAFYPFEPVLQGKTMLTGSYGDSIWSLDSGISPGLGTSTPFGKSLAEFRLRTGFFHVPVPVIGARFPKPIKKISRSRRMSDWSIGGDYDRPIPRRVAEEAGVSRELFGQQKSATAPLPTNHKALFPQAISKVRLRYNRAPQHSKYYQK